MDNQFSAVYEKRGEWWVARAREIPGTLTQGASLEEARENVKEAVALLLQTHRERAEEERVGKSSGRC